MKTVAGKRTASERLATLQKLLVLDSPKEDLYDNLAKQLAKNLDAPIAMINMLDADRDWFKACIGLPMIEASTQASFCEAFFDTGVDLIVVEDALQDARFRNNPHVFGPPFIRFYAGARLSVNGETVGTLCAYDVRPKELSIEQLDHIGVLAGAVIEALRQRAPQSLIQVG